MPSFSSRFTGKLLPFERECEYPSHTFETPCDYVVFAVGLTGKDSLVRGGSGGRL